MLVCLLPECIQSFSRMKSYYLRVRACVTASFCAGKHINNMYRSLLCWCFSFSAMLAVAQDDFKVVVIDTDTWKLVRIFAGHMNQINDLVSLLS